MGDEKIEVMVLSLDLTEPGAGSIKEGLSKGTITILWIIPESSIHLMTHQPKRRQRDSHGLLFLLPFVLGEQQLFAFAVGEVWHDRLVMSII
jgi:hypothetical protein